MIGRDFKFHDGENGAALAIRIKSGGKRNEFRKILKDGTVVVNLERTGEDLGRELIRFLAGELNVAEDRLQIIAGKEGKNILVSVLRMQPSEIQRLIFEKLG